MAIKEIGWMTLQPGDSIGMHKHTNNEDVYVIISGEGLFTDSDGNEIRPLGTIEDGIMTGDLYLLSTLENKKKVNSLEFLDAIAAKLA